MKNNSLQFIAASAISMVLHTIVVAGISGTSGFEFLNLPSEKITLTYLFSETTNKPPIGRQTKKLLSAKVQKDDDKPHAKEIINFPDTSDAGATLKEDSGEKEKVSEGLPEDGKPIENSAATSKINDWKNEENDINTAKTDETDTDEADIKKEDLPQGRIQGDAARLLKYVRESFHYDIYWLGIYVGKAILDASNDNGVTRITSQVHSAPFISKFYKVEDYAESRIVNGVPVNFRIRQHEGRYRSDKETIFDMDNKKITYLNYLKDTREEHPVSDSLPWDVISGFYFLRTQPLEVGKTVYIDVFDSNRFMKVEVHILRREKIELPEVGEIDAVIVRPALKSEGLFQSKGDTLVWLTDDENRTPIRVETKVAVGNVIAELKLSETER